MHTGPEDYTHLLEGLVGLWDHIDNVRGKLNRKGPALSELQIAVVGCGYWGPNLIRNFSDNKRTAVKWVCDLSQERLNAFSKRYPSTQFTTSYDEVLSDPALDAVVIATPVHTHFELAKKAILAGKHVLVEKPMAMNSQECESLIALADEYKRILMVDHTFVYNGAVRRIKESIDRNELGDVLYFDSVRINLGLLQNDVNVIWDLAPHDISIMDYLVGKEPVKVHATGASMVGSKVQEIAYLSLEFADKFIAHFHVSWLSPVKIRRILIGGTKKMIVYDDLEATERVKIYDKGVMVSPPESQENRYQTLVEYRTGDMIAPAYDLTEALKVEVDHFADCIISGRKPLSSGEAGLRVVKIMEAANKSLASGQPESISCSIVKQKAGAQVK